MYRLFGCISTDFNTIAKFVLVRHLTEPAPYRYGAGSVTYREHILSVVIQLLLSPNAIQGLPGGQKEHLIYSRHQL